MADKSTPRHLDNAWISVDASEDPAFYVRFLDASRARALELARKNPEMAFAHLQLKPGLSLLDCGCGTGDMLALASRLTDPGRAVGGDMSATMVEEAKRRNAGRPNLEFHRTDVQSLPFADRSFDRVMATQLLVHVPDPRRALHEMCRVTAKSGRVAIGDMDWDTLVVASSQPDLGRRWARLFSDGVRNGLVVREYKGWLLEEGFTNVQTLSIALAFDQWEFIQRWMIEPSLPHLVATGRMSASDGDALLRDLEERARSGRFFAGSTFYIVTGDRV